MKLKTVLLIEDSASDMELTRRAFARGQQGVQLFTAEDGDEAFDLLLAAGKYAAQAPVIPDLILMDINMPRASGLEVLKRIRQHPQTATFPVVMLTSSREPTDIDTSYRYGANGYIRKPVDFREFERVVECLGCFWLQMNEVVPKQIG